MPRIISYTPSWLTRPSPGFQLFEKNTNPPASNGTRNTTVQTSPSRTIACRGTQIFVAVGTEIRWSDLVLLKDVETDRAERNRKQTPLSDYPESLFRILKTPVTSPITQLNISPLGDFLAIVTSHTIHIAILPRSYALDVSNPMKLKTFQLGPATHVLEASPIVSTLWHPLGVLGRCLVTVTADSVVRLWEIDRENRWSFDRCSLSIDLKKLGNAETAEQNLKASSFGFKAFSPDLAELEPAGAAFGGQGRTREHPWSPMTLWIATTGGDVYALCPLLPTRWQTYPGLINSLSTSITLRTREALQESEMSLAEDAKLRRQSDWISDLEEQDMFQVSHPSGHLVQIASRPETPGPAPKLQGPFDYDIDEDSDISDIVVRNLRVGDEELEFDTGEILDDDDDDESESLAVSLVCLLSKSGTVHILLDLDGVEGQWLPSKTPHSTPSKSAVARVAKDDKEVGGLSLIPFDSVKLSSSGNDQPTKFPFSPSFTPDVQSTYAFFVTHSSGVSYFSMEKWAERLKDQLEDPTETGSDTRLDVSIKTAKTAVEHILRVERDQSRTNPPLIPTCAVLLDSDIGYFVVTSVDGQPRAVNLDTHHQQDPMLASIASNHPHHLEVPPPVLIETADTREPYQADNRFWDEQKIPAFLKSLKKNPRDVLTQQVHLSEATLDILIQAHAAFGLESKQLGEAAARVFRACSRMQDEYRDQIQKVRTLAAHVDGITGEDEDAYDSDGKDKGRARIEQRLEEVQERQDSIQERLKKLKKKLNGINERQPSDKEKAFSAEVKSIESSLNDGAKDPTEQGQQWKRLDEVKQLSKELVARGKEISLESTPSQSAGGSSRQRVPTAVRKQKTGHINDLLAREDAMIDAASKRLQRLSVNI